MCGVFGIVSNTSDAQTIVKLKTLFTLLGIYNDSRGGHSWGMWSKDYVPRRDIGDFKDAPEEVAPYLKAWSGTSGDWIAGHTRFGTHGGRTKENSHPFEVEHITLAHNGVVSVDSTESRVKKHPVDSGQVATLAAIEGIQDAIRNTSGSMTLVWSDDKKERQLYLYRHNQILSLAYNPAWGWAFSSDKAHLEACLALADLTGEITTPKEHYIHAPWDINHIPELVMAPASYSYGLADSWRSSSSTTYYNKVKSYPKDYYDEPGADIEASSEDYDTVSYINNTDEFACRFEDGDVEYITPDNDPHLYADLYAEAEREFKTREEEEEWYATKSVMCEWCLEKPAVEEIMDGGCRYMLCDSCIAIIQEEEDAYQTSLARS